MKSWTVYLASTSPRRRALMRQAGLAFRVLAPDVEEAPRRGEAPAAFAQRAARDKADAVAGRLPARANRGQIVLGCDTVVAVDGHILGKPRDEADARRMLRALSGRDHEVITGLAASWRPDGDRWRRRVRAVRTRVCFRPLAEEEIAAYAASGEPMDKAGAYGIQGGAAGMVRAVHGSYTNVVGLPLAEVLELLNRLSAPRIAAARP